MKYGLHFLLSHVEHLGDLLDGQTSFEILKIVCTGIRVPFSTQAPLTFPGMLSTAGHWDQSSCAIDRPQSYGSPQRAELHTARAFGWTATA